MKSYIFTSTHLTILVDTEEVVHRFVQKTEEVFRYLWDRGIIPTDDTGGYLVIMDRSGACAVPILVAMIGVVSSTDALRYHGFAHEKARRLASGVLVDDSMRSSFQTRAVAQGRYAGAIRAGNLIMSFSGLSEIHDEALMLITAVALSCLTLEEAGAIAKISKNPAYHNALRRYQNHEV